MAKLLPGSGLLPAIALLVLALFAWMPNALAGDGCLDCHGASASDFNLAPVDRAANCPRCHYGNHAWVNNLVQTPYGWFKSEASAYADAITIHADGVHINSEYSTWPYCDRCHAAASCRACHTSVPHARHGSSQVQPVTAATTVGGFAAPTPPPEETFYCGSSSCHTTLPDVNRLGCSNCHTVGKEGHAAAPRTHGDFSATTAACAGCHVTHAAAGPKLLVKPTQTDLCYYCHGAGATVSPFDVQRGLTYNSAKQAWQVSSAGGFSFLGSEAATSIHNVEGYGQNNGTAYDPDLPGFLGTVPGGSSATTGRGLLCSSCHNPHGGTGNARLLNTDFFNGVTGRAVRMTTGANVVVSYDQGFTAWCSACHERFNKGAGSGHTGEDFNGVLTFRHATGVRVPDPTAVLDRSMSGTPLETGSRTEDPSDDNLVACVTCHRSHGTAARSEGYAAEWRRDTDPAGGATGSGSALLRMDNRGVCYNCHRGGEFNKPS